MLQEERQDKIVEYLKQKGFIKVEDLAVLLNVSTMTVRRDLQKCENSGILRRCHGGAVLFGAGRREVSFDEKRTVNGIAKAKIAAICAKLVSEGMTVFLDAGTTVFEISNLLNNVPNLTIITNDIRIAGNLIDSPHDVIMIGGAVQKITGSVIGPVASEMLLDMSFDIAFLGANSINDAYEDMTPTMEKAFFKRRLAQNSLAAYLVADGSKFHSRSLCRINHLKEYAGVVTDYAFSPQERELMEQQGIRIVSAAEEASADIS